MDNNAYKMLEEVYKIVSNEQHVLTANQVNYVTGVLKTMLTLYKDDVPQLPTNGMTEARRAPTRPQQKYHWWDKLIS